MHLAAEDSSTWAKTASRIEASFPPDAREFTAEVRNLAADIMQQGKEDAASSEIESEIHRASCLAELKATREFLADL
jgi:hypothetical protein